jgi:peroxiredoxin Q/BCP
MSGQEEIAMTVHVGDQAPDFTLPTATGEPLTLSSLRGRPVVVYFYPKDETPGCTAEACTFRDQYEEFASAGAEVVGISSDSVSSHQRFAAKHSLPMKLLSDEDGKVRKLYGVKPTLGIIPGRATFVIDAEGVVRLVFSSQFRFAQHAGKALAIIRSFDASANAGMPAAGHAE